MARMLEVEQMPPFPGVRVPDDFWWAYPPPIPLAGMPYPPQDFDWKQAAGLGFRAVVCLTGTDPGYDVSPLSCTAAPLQDLVGGAGPDDPDGQLKLLRRAVDAVIASLREGAGVVIHCRGGRGRSGTVVGAALVALGEGSPGEISAWLDRVHRARDRQGWPESCWQSDILDSFAQRL